ncbi:MAG: cupin domain-containing protein [candidate division WS1 bacterium]|nr:cupin domain-containing protein [candidate division WS1 bacterium]
MSSLDDFEQQGPEREQALARLHAQIAEWGLAMPPVEPILLHFGLHRFREIGETEFWIANETEHGYCGKFLFVFDGQTCPYHHHRVKHETFFLVRGSVVMKVGAEERLMSAGAVLAMPPGTGHSFTGQGPALILEVSMPSIRQDSFFADSEIGEEGVI